MQVTLTWFKAVGKAMVAAGQAKRCQSISGRVRRSKLLKCSRLLQQEQEFKCRPRLDYIVYNTDNVIKLHWLFSRLYIKAGTAYKVLNKQ